MTTWPAPFMLAGVTMSPLAASAQACNDCRLSPMICRHRPRADGHNFPLHVAAAIAHHTRHLPGDSVPAATFADAARL